VNILLDPYHISNQNTIFQSHWRVNTRLFFLRQWFSRATVLVRPMKLSVQRQSVISRYQNCLDSWNWK